MSPRLEDFEILDTIGRGTHGIVRKVRRIKDGQILVWKELYYASMNDAEKQGLVLEVNLLRELHHQNIVRFYHHLVDRNSGTLYIIMEHCPGGDLKQLVKQCRKDGKFLEEKFIWRVLKQVCEALRTCHEKHVNGEAVVLHRDIKPANVFLDEQGNIKLGDFGLAKTLNSEASFARTFVGTPYYMSPEVIDGCEYNERSDIWSLGCLIYELCTLQPPFRAENQRDLALKIKAGRYDRIPKQYSQSLWEMIGLMLTQEDFLRPTALMILYHSSLVANTSSTKDSLEGSLGLSISLVDNQNRFREFSDNASSNLTHKIENSCELSPSNSFFETVKERVISEEEKQMEESLMKEMEALMYKSKLRKAKNTSALDASIGIGEISSNEVSRVNPAIDISSSKLSSSLDNLLKIQEPPICICGGMSHEDWRVRLNSLRNLESNINERERALNEKERELNKREKKIHSLEQDTKQHLVRAQLYLKHAKSKAPQIGILPLSQLKIDNDTDFDATTLSGDMGYDEPPTTAVLNINAKDNPFLKMRQDALFLKTNANIAVSPNKSNTLDNPKSRKRHGNIFYLDKEMSSPNANHESNNNNAYSPNLFAEENEIVFPSKNTVIPNNNTKSQLPNFKHHLYSDAHIKSNQKKVQTLKNITINKENKVDPIKVNSSNIFTTIKNNFSRHNSSRKSKEILRSKENQRDNVYQKEKDCDSTIKVNKKFALMGKENLTEGACSKPVSKLAIQASVNQYGSNKLKDKNSVKKIYIL